jgi:hypothetical protein
MNCKIIENKRVDSKSIKSKDYTKFFRHVKLRMQRARRGKVSRLSNEIALRNCAKNCA